MKKTAAPAGTAAIFLCVVPTAGLEPARLAPLPPQDSVSTNSTTSASIERISSGIRLLTLTVALAACRGLVDRGQLIQALVSGVARGLRLR